MGSGRLAGGALVGFASSVIMDQATSRFYARQSEASKRKEEELAPGGTLVNWASNSVGWPAATSQTTALSESEWPFTGLSE